MGIATNGFNPFGNMSLSYSMWPVVLVPYNLPPWKCMKDPYFMMSLLILGPKAPGRDIDVYLRQLIEELKELWVDGVHTYDIARGERFRLHAAVIWSINDFPTLGNLSGWRTKGYKVCIVCNENTSSQLLRSKICYMGHRRFLSPDHRWRRSKQFDGKREIRSLSKLYSGDEIHEQQSHVNDVHFWKNILSVDRGRKRKHSPGASNWNTGKSKDTDTARLDLADMNIRKELHLQPHGDRYLKPQACYTLTLNERRQFCQFLKSVKFLDGYARIRPFLHQDVCAALVELSCFFQQLCARTLSVNGLNRLEQDIVLILCKLEMVFPPIFFDIMVQLAVHLLLEAKLGGPVGYQWMYPIERFLGKLKKYVRNKARLEGSIAEGYLMNTLHVDKCNDTTKELYFLSCGPDFRVKFYNNCIVNGVCFHNNDQSHYRVTQNCGVMVPVEHDGDPIDFYGELSGVLELNYVNGFRVMLFKCNWFDTDAKKKRIQKDYHLTCINVGKLWYENDPFILAIQA
ncbi:uncharacterized protein LOC116107404 [Pistacia vera]|uniref:uncharacterized protein LOC116107404 n=1 Tax=Pistacia vera TaxID=55513 RepID=UPI001263B15C|nr:uncharacterized protein LOC116107404 [Pistacia vera]